MQLPTNAISAEDAARIAKLSPPKLRELMRTGKIKGIKIKKYWYVDLDSLKSHINSNGSLNSDVIEINGERAVPLIRFCKERGIKCSKRLINDGKLKTIKVNGRHFVVDSEARRYDKRYEEYYGRKIILFKQAAERLKCSDDKLREYIRENFLECIAIGQKVCVFVDSLERLEERLQAGKDFLTIPKGRIRRAEAILNDISISGSI